MSIPGLGQIPVKVNTSLARTVKLQPLSEWRFEVGFGTHVDVKLTSGTAEKDGTELGEKEEYRFAGTKSKIFTWTGCELEVTGDCVEHTAEADTPEDTSEMWYLNLHQMLAEHRAAAARHPPGSGGDGGGGGGGGGLGPRVLVTGGPRTGRTTLVRTLTALATRAGATPVVINADPREGLLSVAGTLTAAVFGTIMDVESEGGGWGGTPSSGPSHVPVKLPLVWYYGHPEPTGDTANYAALVSRVAGAVTARMAEDDDVRCAGVIVDGPPGHIRPDGWSDTLAHIVHELSINIVVVLGSDSIHSELWERFSTETTSVGEPIDVVDLDMSQGVVKRDEDFMKKTQESVVKEYFFGDAKRTLSPYNQQVDFDSLVIYKFAELSAYPPLDGPLERMYEPDTLMAHWTLPVMHASVTDSRETIRTSNVMGFIYVADVNVEKRRLRVLTPVPGRLGDRPLLWGTWPEPFINLLG